MNITRSGLSLFGTRAASIAVGFAGLTVFARELGAAGLGTFFLFQAAVSVGGFVTDAGLRGAAEKRISEGKDPSGTFGTALALKLALLAAFAVVVLLVRRPVSSFVGTDIAVPLVVAVGLREFGRLSKAVLRAELRVLETAPLTLLWKVVYVATGVAAVAAGAGARGVVYAYVLGQGVLFVSGAFLQSTLPGRPSLDRARSLGVYALPRFAAGLGGVVQEWVDVVVIAVFLTQSHVGRYEVAWRVSGIVLTFTYSLTRAAFPQMSEWSGTGATDRIEETLPKLVTASLAVVVPAFFGAVVLSREILDVVFGPVYATAWLAFSVVMVKNVGGGVDVVVNRTLRAIDRPDLNARAVAVAIGCNVVLNVVLVPVAGIVGAGLATTAAALVGTLLSVAYLSGQLTVRFPTRAVAWIVVAAASMAVVVGAVEAAVGVDRPLGLVATVALGVSTYGVLALAAPPLRRLAVDALAAIGVVPGRLAE